MSLQCAVQYVPEGCGSLTTGGDGIVACFDTTGSGGGELLAQPSTISVDSSQGSAAGRTLEFLCTFGSLARKAHLLVQGVHQRIGLDEGSTVLVEHGRDDEVTALPIVGLALRV